MMCILLAFYLVNIIYILCIMTICYKCYFNFMNLLIYLQVIEVTRESPFYFQSADHDCVPACVLSLAELYDVKITLKELRKILVTNPQSGTIIGNMRNLGNIFDVQIGRLSDLSELPQHIPFIAYLRRAHAIVVLEYDPARGKVVVGDPAVGIVQIPLQA